MIEQLLQSFTAREAMVIVGCAVSTYFIARDAQRTARAVGRKLDRLMEGSDGRPGMPERVTRLEEGRKTDHVELLRVRDNAHYAIGSLGAVVGFADHAIDIVGGAVGKTLPHPKLVLPKRAGEDEGDGTGQ